MNAYRHCTLPHIRPFFIILSGLTVSLLMLSGCTLLPTSHLSPVDLEFTPRTTDRIATVSSVNEYQSENRNCSSQFMAHALDHTTMAPGGETIRMFEANGGGVAVNDLDGDGWLDIVMANHRDPNTILWNRGILSDGVLTFETQRIGNGDARAANIVDVDGDGLLDIVFSRRVSAPNFWRNTGNRRFEQIILPGVSKPLYAINWGDLDQDGDLDLVGGTYDAGLLAEFGQEFLNGSEAGVYVYMQTDGAFRGEPLALNAQALALVLVDLNDDQRLDILVGNDFGVPDYGWLNVVPDSVGSDGVGSDGVGTDGVGANNTGSSAIAWETLPLGVMSHSTMSYAAGDVDNDGRFELFSTDMMPYAQDPETMAAWQPVMAGMMEGEHAEDDPQLMANVLRPSYLEGPGDATMDLAPALGISASGWSWSGKFGDLDQDGLLDLYIVNGMIEATTFAHLPNHELQEENQAFHNYGRDGFIPAPEWALNATESGRGMTMADLDNDGDLDIVVNNLRGPAKLFENQLCMGNSLLVDLSWKSSGNTRAIGAVVTLHTAMGRHQRRVDAASGYLSGEASQIHFGFADGIELKRLEVLWPDGELSVVEAVKQNSRVTVERQ